MKQAPRPPAAPHAPAAQAHRAAATPLAERYARVRAQTMALAAPLSEADCQVQSMPDASPTKWHLAHVTWFFETFVLERFEAGFRPHHPAFRVLFNSYYHGVGEQHPRPQRGLVTRPGLAEVKAYRAAVDERMAALLEAGDAGQAGPHRDPIATLVELGLQHEQQHQELILTDLKHLLGCSPLAPVYRPAWPLAAVAPVAHGWCSFDGGPVEIGHGGEGFAFDNEAPRHAVQLRPHALGNRLVTHGEWREFIEAGGYAEPRWWLAAGWDWLRQQRIEAPMYWRRRTDDSGRRGWVNFTLHGEVPVDPHTPVVHVSLYEADAYARWRAAVSGEPVRLPSEAEWEHAAQADEAAALAEGNFVDSEALHPMPLRRMPPGAPMQLFGDVWEWTTSSYQGYPGFRPWAGAVGEYNGKFMINQYVLRGGSCATPREHMRASYRNFFPAETRWQFSGVRLAKDLD
ncbi:MAG: ergothioneine biosynthesis protein EgtB [Burkholderiales bacterium]|nr:ergothioneine biosynthesis protein EgtB [Burkholderiales bacterium]